MRYLFGKPRQAIAIEWGDGEIRMSLPARGGRMTGTFPLTAPTEEQGFEVTRRLQELMKRGNLSAPFCIVIPSHACTFKLMKLPSGNGEVREQIWKNEAATQLGLPLTEIELAFSEQPEGVLVAAVRKSFLHTYLSPFVQLDLPVRWVVPSIVGLWISIQKPPTGGWGILELRGTREKVTGATIALGSAERLRLIHTISLNGGNGEWLVGEIQRTLALYHRTFGETIARIFVVGNKSLISELEGVRGLPPMEELPLEAEGNTVSERVLSAIAYAVISNPNILSFPPPEREPTLVWRRLEERLVGALAVLAVIGFIASFAFSSRTSSLGEQVKSAQNLLAQHKRDLERLTAGDFGKKVQSLEQIWKMAVDPRNDPLELLYWVSKALPTSVWVTELAFIRDGQVVLRGSALSHSAVTDAARSLSELELDKGKPLFIEVLTNYANAKTVADRTLVEFQITAWLRERTTQRQRQVLRP
ncbi:MAG: PilN domain-containing protein [Armatimonadetes bacterium]|nr:PilN domain-containing protein [Armatimonadota bacterium]MCX7969114.1 PilN domain-containing protein [Armatimonadota bacterium]MDW8143345.1 PilN domain-containing protein [Armatimonadota bacterium]